MLRNSKAKGFTLIELLVAISIIGLLTGIAIPTYVNYRQRANDQHMVSDLKNAVTAMEAYFLENNAYTSSVADLLALGFKQTAGVSLAITLTGSESYTLTASMPNGTRPSFTYDSKTGRIQ